MVVQQGDAVIVAPELNRPMVNHLLVNHPMVLQNLVRVNPAKRSPVKGNPARMARETRAAKMLDQRMCSARQSRPSRRTPRSSRCVPTPRGLLSFSFAINMARPAEVVG